MEQQCVDYILTEWVKWCNGVRGIKETHTHTHTYTNNFEWMNEWIITFNQMSEENWAA